MNKDWAETRSAAAIKSETIQWLRNHGSASSAHRAVSRMSVGRESATQRDTPSRLSATLSANQMLNRSMTHDVSIARRNDGFNKSTTSLGVAGLSARQRSKSMGPSEFAKSSPNFDREEEARRVAENAMKTKKIFTIIGPYPSLRDALRRRGWVEKQLKDPTARGGRRGGGPGPPDKHDARDDFVKESDSKENIQPLSTEDEKTANIMSVLVRNSMPRLVFTMKTADVISYTSRTNQIVNHFSRSSNFTTKTGLCQSMRSVPWYSLSDPDMFYPRCFNLVDLEDREAFFEDYRLTACCAFMKHFVACHGVDLFAYDSVLGAATTARQRRRRGKGSAAARTFYPRPSTANLALDRDAGGLEAGAEMRESEGEDSGDWKTEEKWGVDENADAGGDVVVQEPHLDDTLTSEKTENPEVPNKLGDGFTITSASEPPRRQSKVKGSKVVSIPLKVLKFAIRYCRNYLMFRDNEDLDALHANLEQDESDWRGFFKWHYIYTHDSGSLEAVDASLVKVCRDLLLHFRCRMPQFDLDGSRNVWILKPGAKSRGRGILCLDKYEDILTAIDSGSECAFVAQKYIERPLLVYRTKFDVRQWFLVTDWRPLTVWWYDDCYLRFCSQEFSLDDLDVSVHLSNNSVQKYYDISPTRSKKLPDDNMWTSYEFQTYLGRHGYGPVWTRQVVPGMKQAILCALLSSQENVECRKMAFELYGADFMLSEDMQPWLIEINSSPSMARTTRATAQLVDSVLEDLLKVVLDRQTDRHCDTGKFELFYKQPIVDDPPVLTPNLTIQGRKIRKCRIVK